MVRKKVPFYSLIFSCFVILSPYVMQEGNTRRKAGSNKESTVLQYNGVTTTSAFLFFTSATDHFCDTVIIYICSVIFTIPKLIVEI